MTARWRRDAVDAQQLGLPRVVGLLLIVAGLSAVSVPFPYGLMICLVALALLAVALRRNSLRRGEGIDGWPNTLILAPIAFMTSVVVIGTVVSEPLAAVFAGSVVVVGSALVVRRLRRSPEPDRSAHHFRGTAPPDRS